VSPRVGLDAVAKRKIPNHCRIHDEIETHSKGHFLKGCLFPCYGAVPSSAQRYCQQHNTSAKFGLVRGWEIIFIPRGGWEYLEISNGLRGKIL
jgi:hypothetical protein